MSRDATKSASKSPGRKTAGRLSDVPNAGAIGKDEIKSVDLKPRSNGENDWQDEMPADKRRDSDR
jgi:hypothetical protein